jgi:hypothetical protein
VISEVISKTWRQRWGGEIKQICIAPHFRRHKSCEYTFMLWKITYIWKWLKIRFLLLIKRWRSVRAFNLLTLHIRPPALASLQAFTTVRLRSSFFWDMEPCQCVSDLRYFETTDYPFSKSQRSITEWQSAIFRMNEGLKLCSNHYKEPTIKQGLSNILFF